MAKEHAKIGESDLIGEGRTKAKSHKSNLWPTPTGVDEQETMKVVVIATKLPVCTKDSWDIV